VGTGVTAGTSTFRGPHPGLARISGKTGPGPLAAVPLPGLRVGNAPWEPRAATAAGGIPLTVDLKPSKTSLVDGSRGGETPTLGWWTSGLARGKGKPLKRTPILRKLGGPKNGAQNRRGPAPHGSEFRKAEFNGLFSTRVGRAQADRPNAFGAVRGMYQALDGETFPLPGSNGPHWSEIARATIHHDRNPTASVSHGPGAGELALFRKSPRSVSRCAQGWGRAGDVSNWAPRALAQSGPAGTGTASGGVALGRWNLDRYLQGPKPIAAPDRFGRALGWGRGNGQP